MTTNPNTRRHLFTAAFAVILLLICAASCSVQDAEPIARTNESLSSPGAGDEILSYGAAYWEQASVVVPAGADSHCPNGRVFFSGDGHVYYADLACVRSGTCTPNTTTDLNSIIPTGSTWGIVNGPGPADSQFIRMKDGSIMWVRNAVRMKLGQAFGALLVWRSGDCGTTWAFKGAFDGETVLDGRCGWPWMDSHLAVYRSGASPATPGTFIIDENGNGTEDDATFTFGRSSNPINNVPIYSDGKFQPVLGVWDANDFVQDWTLDSSGVFIPQLAAKAGLFDNGKWYLDTNGDRIWDPPTDWEPGADRFATFGSAGEIPIVGKWNAATGDNRDLIGTYHDAATVGAASMFYLDLNGNYSFDGCNVDGCVPFGTKGDKPLPLMNGTAAAKGRGQVVGVYRPSNGTWYGDTNGNRVFDGCSGGDTCLTTFNQGSSALPVIGYWPGPSGKPQIGTFQSGTWKLDANADGVWNAGDLTYSFGVTGDIPLVEFPSYSSQEPGNPSGPGAAYPSTFDRPEAYADPNNPGWLYVVANCSYNQTREMVVGWSYDYGVHWGATQAFNPPRGDVPLMMTSMGGDHLYLFGGEWTSPVFVPLSVNVAAKTVTAKSPWYPFALSGTFSSPPDSSTFMDQVYSSAVALATRPMDGSFGIAGLDRVLTTDRLLAVYPAKRSGITDIQAARVMEVKVDWNGSSVANVQSAQAAYITSTDAGGHAAQVTMIQGPTPTRTALTYWKSVTDVSGTQTMYNAWRGYAAGSLPFDFGAEVQTSGNLSLNSSGNKRTWGGVGTNVPTGDYVKGASYAGPSGPEFFTHWVESTSTEILELHTKTIGVPQNGPTWGSENLSGNVSGGPAVAAWGSNRLDVMFRGLDNQLWHLYYNGTWHAGEAWGGSLSSSPAVTGWGVDRLDVVARQSDGHIWHLYYDATLNPVTQGFGGDLGPAATGTPAITNWGYGRLDVFARSTGNALVHKYCDYNGLCWGPAGMWESRGTPPGATLVGGVGATAWGVGRLDAFARCSDGNLWQEWYDSSLPGGWQPWANIGRPSAGLGNADPAVTSWGPNQLDVYVVGNSDGNIYRRRYNNGWVQSWENLGSNRGTAFQTGVAADNWAVGRTDLFAIGPAQELLHAFVQE